MELKFLTISIFLSLINQSYITYFEDNILLVDNTFVHNVNKDIEGNSSKNINIEIIDQIKILNPCQLNLLEKYKVSVPKGVKPIVCKNELRKIKPLVMHDS